MKKILCLILTLVLSFGLVSCNLFGKDDKDDGGGNDNGGNTNGGNKISAVEVINNTVNSSKPTQIVSKIDYIVVGEDTLTSSYTTEIDEKHNVEKFTFHIVRRSTDLSDPVPGGLKKIDGTVWKNADGSVTNSEGDTWSASDAVGFLAEKISLKESYLKNVEISADGNDLTAYVSADNAESVFGAAVKDAKGDIKIVVDTNGTYLYNVTVTYNTTSGATINIVTSYDYAVIDLTTND